jgi:hypothetical protein
MRQRRWFLVLPAVAIAACGGKDQPRVDDALSRDLSLAATAQPYPQQQVVSPAEMGYGPPPQQGYAPGYYPPQGYYPAPQQVPVAYRGGYPAPVQAPSPAPAPSPSPAPRRTVRRAPASGPVYSSSAGTVRSAPVRHTKRDALIGVAAGTIAGAAIGKDTKGALIGAAAGGLIGAAVGHTIDVNDP